MIAWITERLGTAAFDDIPIGSNYAIVDVRDLVDRSGNQPSLAAEKIEQALGHIARGEKVVIACDYGRSRSNAVAAGVLAKHANVPLADALRSVVARAGHQEISLAVLSAVRRAIEGDAAPPARRSSGRRLIVTGGNGFIGSHLIPALRNRHLVLAPGRQALDLSRGSLELDALVREQGADGIIHLANPRIYNTDASLGESLVMLRHVLEVCRENRLALIYLSGWEIYTGYREPQLADETLAPRPKSLYGQTKHLCETMIEQYRELHGLERTLIRVSPVYGPGGDRPKFIHAFIEKARRGDDIVTHRYENGFPNLDLLHVDDLVLFIVACVDSKIADQFNIGTGIRTSTAQVAERIHDMVGSRSRVIHRQIADWAPDVAMDARHAVETFGWHPRVDLHMGLRGLLEPEVKAVR